MSAEASTTWRSRPVFISSTFRDLQAERDHLQHVIFPRLAEVLRGRRHFLEPIDLRTGVEAAADSEGARELQVLKVCLTEIERSRPYLLVLLGDRYGWVPGEERLRAAAQEAGFQTDLAGRSVTALEIEFGLLLKDPAQRRRCFFYFRDPLPCADMPPDLAARFSDGHAADPQAAQRQAALAALKRRIEQDPELGPRVRHYGAQWVPAAQRVTGLEAWGEQVYADLWGDLDRETAAFAAQPLPGWESQERQALEEFLELRRRGFTGREELLQELKGFALGDGPLTRPAGTLAPTGGEGRGEGEAVRVHALCLTGVPGAGKSAFLAELHRRLAADGSPLLLTHAAGISPRSGSVLDMLRRWIGELANFLNLNEPLRPDASADDVEQTFTSLLGRAAQRRRVVVLVDALNQFEPTPRGRFVTWLPALWPPNARLVATTLPGEASDALARKPGLALRDLPPLTAADAEGIARQVWTRYHRTLPADVLAVLAEKRWPDGTLSCGNPLWLTLAAEQLNLLDADDFERAERDYAARPAHKRVPQLLRDTAAQLPPDVEGLYGWMLRQCGRVFGRHHAAAFAAAIALSRYGWRESDLRELVPRFARVLAPGCDVADWTDLRLAGLRRSFRAHLAPRGELGRWDFFHAQTRLAIEREVMPEPGLRRQLHAALADYLETLPEQEPLRQGELMWHLIGADDRLRAARFYASLTVPLGTPEHPATRTLATHILSGGKEEQNPNLAWVTALLDQPRLELDTLWRLSNRLQFDLHDALENEAPLGVRLMLLAATCTALQRLAAADPSNAGWQRDLSVSHNKVGDVLLDQGDLGGALAAYRQSLAVAERLAAADPSNAGWQRDLSVSHERIGDVLRAQGDLGGALAAYRQSLAVRERLAAADPSNAGWQRDLSVSHNKVGDVLRAQGDLGGALAAYRQTQAILERLAAADPSNAGWQRDLFVSYWRLAMMAEQNGTGDALEWWRKAYEKLSGMKQRGIMLPTDEPYLTQLREKVNPSARPAVVAPVFPAAQAAQSTSSNLNQNAAVPKEANLTEPQLLDLAERLFQSGLQRRTQGDLAGALQEFQGLLQIRRRLAESAPTDTQRLESLAIAVNCVGVVRQEQGDLKGALEAFAFYREAMERLVAADPANVEWQVQLCVSYINTTDALDVSGDPAARDWCRRSIDAVTRMQALGGSILCGSEKDLQRLRDKYHL